MKQVRILILAIIAVVVVFLLVKKSHLDGNTVAYRSSSTTTSEARVDFNEVPVKGMVTMIDLGANECIPCKMMEPILKKLTAAYSGKAVIAFIDAWENRDQAHRFGVRAIPTQVFFDPDGKEVYRHQGFMSEDAIVEQLTRMGVEKPTL